MKHYQLSKYKNGDDGSWTAFSDIGETFGGKVLTQEEYLAVEDAYINVLHSFLVNGGCGEFSVIRVEDDRGQEGSNNRYYGIDNPLVKIRGGEILDINTMLTLFRLCLRETMWIRVESKLGCYIGFGYDFYVRLGVADSAKIDTKLIKSLGLFLHEVDEDPYG